MPVKERYWRATALEETIYRCFYRKSCSLLYPAPGAGLVRPPMAGV